MAILSDEERRLIRLRVQIEHLSKRLNIEPARIDAQRLLTKAALTAARSAVAGQPQVKRLQARGAHFAVGVGMASRKQLAGTVTTGEQTFSGYLSTWDEDTSGDICQPGC